MKCKHYLAILGCVALGLTATATLAADEHPARPTPEQMKAVHDCAAAKGVELPPPPQSMPPKGEKPPMPPQGGEGKDHPPHPPKLTDAQRAIVDACFKEAGIEPPKGPPPHKGHGGDHKGPPPSGDKPVKSE